MPKIINQKDCSWHANTNKPPSLSLSRPESSSLSQLSRSTSPSSLSSSLKTIIMIFIVLMIITRAIMVNWSWSRWFWRRSFWSGFFDTKLVYVHKLTIVRFFFLFYYEPFPLSSQILKRGDVFFWSCFSSWSRENLLEEFRVRPLLTFYHCIHTLDTYNAT